MATILGEADPGFNLWTSAHGFHHLSLTQSKCWKCFWGVIIFILTVSLLGCIAFYFYFVFSSAIYSRVLLDSPVSMNWPTTIVCDRQMFSSSKIASVPQMSASHASLLSWSVDPRLARPDVMNNTRVAQITNDISTILTRADYNKFSYGTTTNAPLGGPMDQLMRAVAPNCTQLILQCTVGNTSMSGFDCCARIFDPNPYFTAQGTCYSTRGGIYRPQILVAGDASSLTITTMHDVGNLFDPLFAHSSIYGVSGLNFAVVDDNVTVQAAMAGRSQSILPGTYASVSLSRTVIDNKDLQWSAIGKIQCVTPGDRDPKWVDADLNYGIDYRYGYSRDACTMQSKMEMAARELLLCTFNPLSGDTMQRCNANQSVSYYRSFIDPNVTATPDIQVVNINNKVGLSTRYNKKCPADCYQDRYTATASYSALTDIQKQSLQTLITSSGQAIAGGNPNVVVLKLSMSTMENQRIYNFPQPGLQFVAEIGGLMSFLLGISVISVIECVCYCCCCGCCKQGRTDEDKGYDNGGYH